MTPHIVIECIGSRGDVEPYVALGQGLSGAGFDVTIATHEPFRTLIESTGLRFRSVAGDPTEIVQSARGLHWLDSGRNPVRMITRLRELAQPLMNRYLADTEAALIDADAVVFSVLGVAAYHVAEQRQIPAIGGWLAPMSRTSELRNPMVSFLPTGLGHRVFEQVMWQFVRRDMNDWRRRLGLQELPWHGPYQTIAENRMPVLYGFSPTLVPPPSDWPEYLEVTGAWVRHRSERLPADLEDFLSAGPPPIYVGFGSRSDPEAATRSDAVRGALRLLGQRAIISTGWGGLEASDGPETITVDETNHELLFPRCAAIVHHGGAGTTHTAARSGRPSVVIPDFADQFFWGERIWAAGAGPRPLPRRHVTADALAVRIDDALHRHAGEAGRVGARMRSEQGVARAVAAIRRMVDT